MRKTMVAWSIVVAWVATMAVLVPVGRAGAVEGRVDLHVADRRVVWSETVELRATVPRSLTARPTGTITFVADGTLTLGTVTLKARAVPEGTVVLRRRDLPPGEHTVTATYSGDRRYPAATSAPTTVQVAPARATVTLRSARAVVAPGKVARFIARVAPVAPATAVPTGSLTFTAGAVTRSVPIVDGVAIWMPRLPDGLHVVRAVLPESAAWDEVPSAPVTQRVGPEPVPAIDQQSTSSSGETLLLSPSGPFPAAAQIVTAGVTGTLEAVELEAACFGMSPVPGGSEPQVSVKALVGGSPTGATLATAGPMSDYDDAAVLGRFALSPPVPVTAGTSYAVVVAAPSGVLGCTAGLATDGQSLALMGTTWTTGATALRHRTWVRPAG